MPITTRKDNEDIDKWRERSRAAEALVGAIYAWDPLAIIWSSSNKVGVAHTVALRAVVIDRGAFNAFHHYKVKENEHLRQFVLAMNAAYDQSLTNVADGILVLAPVQ